MPFFNYIVQMPGYLDTTFTLLLFTFAYVLVEFNSLITTSRYDFLQTTIKLLAALFAGTNKCKLFKEQK